MRTYYSSRIYGWQFGAFAPLRVLWGNLVNLHATVKALWQFGAARMRRSSLSWQKTEHSFPAHIVPATKQLLGAVLVRMQYLDTADLESAILSQPSGSRLGEHLIQLRKLTEINLYRALSSQAGIPLGSPLDREVSHTAARLLPADLARRWHVLPYRVDMGQLHLATTEVPSAEMVRELAGASALNLRFRLLAPWEFEKLRKLAEAQPDHEFRRGRARRRNGQVRPASPSAVG